MEDIRQDSVTTFDACFTNNHIRMLKVLLPFLEPSMQRGIAIYIKFMELQYTFSYFRRPSRSRAFSQNSSFQKKDFDFNTVCNELFPYCTEQEKRHFSQMRDTFQTMNNMKDMMEMMETMKEMFPEGMGSGGDGGFNPEMLATMSGMFGGSGMDLGGMDLGAMADLFSGGS